MFYLIFYFLLWIIGFAIILSVMGKSTGIREKCASGLVALFEYAAEYEAKVHNRKQTKSFTLMEETDDSESDNYNDLANEDVEDTIYEHRAGNEQRKKNEKHQVLTDAEKAKGIHGRVDHNDSDHLKTRLIRQNSSGELAIIDRRWTSSLDRKLRSRSTSRDSSYERLYSADPELDTLKEIILDTGLFISSGIEAIIEDEVTSRFKAAQLITWNFLSRNCSAHNMSWRMILIWFIGWIIRYFILFPIRFLLFCISGLLLVLVPTIIGCIPDEKLRDRINRPAMLMIMRMASRSFSAIVTFHNTENRPAHGICVANHTSPIDVMNLSCDNCYAMIGQRQGGFLGIVQRSLSRSAHHIWFERSESKDRQKVSQRLREHVDDPNKLPILIFPEGTCINNTSVMLFKKGSFEISTTIYPIAIRYDNRLGDAFWNSHEQSYLAYLLSMMTAWAMVCHVWYLPPVSRKEGESPINFARRVQRMIAKAGGLVDLEWDGNLKRSQVPERLKDEQKELFYRYLARTTALCECGNRSTIRSYT